YRAGQHDFASELTDGPLTAADDSDALFVFALRVDKQLATGDFNVDVVPVDAREFDLHEVAVVGLFHIGKRARSAVEQPRKPRPRLDEARKTTVETVKLVQRVAMDGSHAGVVVAQGRLGHDSITSLRMIDVQ